MTNMIPEIASCRDLDKLALILRSAEAAISATAVDAETPFEVEDKVSKSEFESLCDIASDLEYAAESWRIERDRLAPNGLIRSYLGPDSPQCADGMKPA